MRKGCLYGFSVIAVATIILSGCGNGKPQDIQESSSLHASTDLQTTVSSTNSGSVSTDEYPILGSKRDIWIKKYGKPQGENLASFEQDYILVKFFDKPEAYDIFLQFVYLDQKRRTAEEADTIVKQFLPKDSIIKETGKKESDDENDRYYTQIDIYDSSTLQAVFGDGHIEAKKRVWTDSDINPGISDISLTYLTDAEIKMLEEISQESESTDQNEANSDNVELIALMDSLQQANKEQLMQHRDILETTYHEIIETYKGQKTKYNSTEWTTFVTKVQANIDKDRNEFIKVFVDIRQIPNEHIKFVLPIAELFAKLKQDLIVEMGKDLDGKTNKLPQVKMDIENLFLTLKNDGL